MVCAWRWWRGLDSNQRTLARADLQSAAFNHSATSPGGCHALPVRWTGEHGKQARHVAARVSPVNAACQPKHQGNEAVAGEGNRTLVVSLEGFCSTIELHPPGRLGGPTPLAARARQSPPGLTPADAL